MGGRGTGGNKSVSAFKASAAAFAAWEAQSEGGKRDDAVYSTQRRTEQSRAESFEQRQDCFGHSSYSPPWQCTTKSPCCCPRPSPSIFAYVPLI